MSIAKRVLNPERLRQVPEHFSWIDHRLVREHTIEKADVCAWALYLFVVTVADAHGSSYYAEASLSRRLGLSGLDLPDFAALNPALKVWLESVANIRLHRETHRRPVDLWAVTGRQIGIDNYALTAQLQDAAGDRIYRHRHRHSVIGVRCAGPWA